MEIGKIKLWTFFLNLKLPLFPDFGASKAFLGVCLLTKRWILSLSLFLSLSLSLSLRHTHTHSVAQLPTHTCTLAYTHAHAQFLSLSPTLSLRKLFLTLLPKLNYGFSFLSPLLTITSNRWELFSFQKLGTFSS